MKKKYTFILLALLSLTSISIQAQSSWIEIPSGTTKNLRDIFFSDSLTGWIVGDSGTVLKSTDGGMNWTGTASGLLENLLSIQFINSDSGWITPEFGMPFITTNGGSSWGVDSMFYDFGSCYGNYHSFSPEGTGMFLYGGCFGVNHIYTLTGDTAIDHDFISIWPPFELDDVLRSIDHSLPGISVGMGDNGMIIRTTDDGVSWTSNTPDTTMQFADIDFSNDVSREIGYAVTSDLYWPLYKTTDAGLTWEIDSTWMATFFYPNLRTVKVVDTSRILAGGYLTWSGGGLIQETNSFIYESVRSPVYDIETSTTNIFAVGDTGMIVTKTIITSIGDYQTFDHQPTLKAYPNPAQYMVQICWEVNFNPEFISVSDMTGKEILRKEVGNDPSPTITLDIREFSTGMYVVSAISGTQKIHTKLLVD